MTKTFVYKKILRQMTHEREYFTRLRATIYAHALPTLIIHEGSAKIEWVYPDYVNDAIDHVNAMETVYMSKYDNVLNYVKNVNVL